MKKYIFIISIILTFYNNIKIYSNQEQIWVMVDSVFYPPDYQYPYEFNYFDIACADSQNCVAIGNMMKIMPWNRYTSNGGKTWTTTLADSTYRANISIKTWLAISVAYPDTNLCIVLCDSNYYWRSIDNCRSWEKNNVNGIFHSNQQKSSKVQMINSQFGSIITPWELYLTINGGQSWYKQKINIEDSLLPKVLNDVYLTSLTNIKILAWRSDRSYYIINSDNFGKSWTVYDSTPRKVYKLHFLNKDTGWACGGNQIEYGSSYRRNCILKTIDGGKTWKVQLDSFPEKRMGLKEIKFWDSNNGIALGLAWNLWRKTNGGETWVQDKSNNQTSVFSPLRNFCYLNKNEILGVSEDALIYKSVLPVSVLENQCILSSDRSFIISPNPANDYIEISMPSVMLNSIQHPDVRIYNVFGELVYPTPVQDYPTPALPKWREFDSPPLGEDLGGVLKIDISALLVGVYFVRVGEKTGKFVKI